jgi:predicted DCC family thiol-disulfide oxidoreductase YuxK
MTLTERIQRWWFTPQHPATLGALRLIVFGWLFLWYLPKDFAVQGAFPNALWHPVWLFDVLGVPLAPVAMLAVASVVWKAALVLAALGVFTRASIAVSLIGGAFLLGTTHSFFKVNHGDAVLLFIMLILVVSRCGDAWSVDSLVRAARHAGRGLPTAIHPHSEYRWPIRMVWVLFAVVFFLAGVSKLINGRLAWMFSDSMMNIVLEVQNTRPQIVDIRPYAEHITWFFPLAAIGTVIVELAAPLVLISKWARAILVPALFGMQFGIFLLMGDDFTQFMIIYTFFLPLGVIGFWFARRAPGVPRVVLYDGMCGLCGRTVAVLKRLDLLHKLDFIDAAGNWGRVTERYPDLDQAACLDDMHVIDQRGRATAGFDAYRSMAWILPLGWLALPVLYLPGVPRLGRRVYAFIAARRERACVLPQHQNA